MMELDVVVADYQRFARDNERNWGVIHQSLDQIENDNATGMDLTFHVSFFRSKLSDFSRKIRISLDGFLMLYLRVSLD